MSPLAVEWTAAFTLDGWIDVNGGAFRRNDSKSRKWLENDESMKGLWPIPSERNGWFPFGPKIVVFVSNKIKINKLIVIID